jgi:broad specificity phosphatase PhoE
MISNVAITRFGLVRHAVTEWNANRRIQGHSDSPLTNFGKKQAEAWGKCLSGIRWNRILSSDLGRTRKTAELINQSLHVPIELDAGLREMNWGQWTGKTMAQVRNEYADLLARQITDGWTFCPPEGESYENAWNRGREALTAAADSWPGENILVITHEGMIKCLMYHEHSLKDSLNNKLSLMPYHLHRMVVEDGKLTIELPNEMDLSFVNPSDAS